MVDPTRIVVPPEDLRILIGTTAQLSCLAEYDKSFSNDFELLWEKDDMEISLNYTENSRYFFFFPPGSLQTLSNSETAFYPQFLSVSLTHLFISRYFVEDGVLQIINVSHRDQGVYRCVARTPVDRDMAPALLLVLGERTCSPYFCIESKDERTMVLH